MAVVVVFRSRRTSHSDEEYARVAQRMDDLVHAHPGFVSMTTVRDPGTREGITVGLFEDEDAVRAWRDAAEHAHARERGRQAFYEAYEIIVATVTRSYEWASPDLAADE